MKYGKIMVLICATMLLIGCSWSNREHLDELKEKAEKSKAEREQAKTEEPDEEDYDYKINGKSSDELFSGLEYVG